jgi:hypothetical protein
VVSRNGERSEPVRQAIVTVSGSELPSGQSAMTDDEGRYVVERLPAGRYAVTARKPGYLPGLHGAKGPGRPGVALVLAAGAHLTDVAVAMTRGAAISGTITDPQGRPAAGMVVRAIRLSAAGGSPTTSVLGRSDRHGRYRIFGLVPGDYVISAAWSLTDITRDVTVRTSAEIDAVLTALDKGQPVSAAGSPGIERPERPQTIAPVYHPGVVDQARATVVPVSAGEDRTDVDVQMTLARTANVEGVVTSPWGSRADVALTLLPRGRDLVATAVPRTRPDADGRFVFRDVSPGSYTLEARTVAVSGSAKGTAGSGQGGEGDVLWARTDIDVDGEDVSSVALFMRPALHLAGRVIFRGPLPSPTLDLSRGRVSAVNTSDEGIRRRATSGVGTGLALPIAPVARDGSFRLDGLTPGSYEIRFDQAPAGWSLRSAIMAGIDVLDTGFLIDTDTTRLPEIVLTFTNRRTTLSGVLQVASTDDPSSFFVVVFPAERALWRPDSRRVKTTRVDAEGSWQAGDLPPGDYLLAVTSDFVPDDLLVAPFLERLAEAARKISLAEGENRAETLRIRTTAEKDER